MNDFNRGALQVPCLRLDYGFGEHWASVELGDGTGYVRLSDYEMAVAENAKLRELVGELWGGYNDPRCEECHLKDTPTCADCPICAREAAVIDSMRELGIETEAC